METGWTEEERSTGGTAARGEREEGKGKSGKLSSQNRNGRGRKKPEGKGKGRRRKQKASTREAAAGAELGGTKGNRQKGQVRKAEGKHGKPGWKERGKPKKRKRKGAPEKPL